jgi:hypothetical protein
LTDPDGTGNPTRSEIGSNVVFVATGSFMRIGLVAVACCLFAPALAAQDARVYTANSSNGRIELLTFDPPSATTVNTDANQRTTLRSLVIRDDGVGGSNLVACDTQAGEVVFYAGSAGDGVKIVSAGDGGPSFPDGASLDVDGNLFLVSSANGNGNTKTAQAWVVLRDLGDSGSSGFPALPGGYRKPFGKMDGEVKATTPIGGVDTLLTVHALEDTFRVPAAAGVLASGDLLVVASDPAMLLRYRAADVHAYVKALRAMHAGGAAPAEIDPVVLIHPPESSVAAERKFPSGTSPSGVAIAPDGSLLVPVEGGDVLIYGPDGVRRSVGGTFVDFADDLGNGKFKIAIGPQGGKFRAFLSNRNGGQVLRFTIAADDTGVADGSVTSGLEFPVGLATTTSSLVPTPRGNGVSITPNVVLSDLFESVVTPGVTSSKVILFEDPREKEIETPDELPLHRSLLLTEISEDLPAIEIPAYVRSMRLGDAVTGPPTFILVLLDTTAQLAGVSKHFAEESEILGYEAECGSPDPWKRPRVFWAPTPDEEPIVEGAIVVDITDACGSDRGLTRNTLSVFLPGSRDTRASRDIAGFKVDNLKKVFAAATCIDKRVKAKIDKKMDTVSRSFDRNKYADAATALNDIAAIVIANPGAFTTCSGTLGAEILARIGSAVFSLNLVP